jgi:hypothetical protein
MATPNMPWNPLPLDIRLMILEELIRDGCDIALYTTVSREWQAIIEPHNFNRLKVTTSRLASFGENVYRSRGLVRYIWLCIELQEYDRFLYEEGETDAWHECNTEIIKRAIQELFLALSTWEASKSLFLDISVHAPSDSKQHFKYLQIRADAVPVSEDDDTQQTVESHHDPRHG